MKKYKIAFVVNHFPSVSETFIINQITDLIDKGHQVKIYSLNARKLSFTHNSIDQYNLIKRTTYFRYSHRLTLKKISWFFLFIVRHFWALGATLKVKILSPNALRRGIRHHALSLSLQHFLNAEKFDVVHVHFGQRGAIIGNLLQQRKVSNFKFLVTFHGYDLDPSKIDRYKIEYKNLFLWADAVTVNTKYLESILLKVCSNPKKLVVLPAGLKTEQYKRQSTLSDSPKYFTIVYCGRFIELKAPDLAVKIVNVLVNERGFKNVRLRMIGDGELREVVETLIHQFRLQDHVTLLGSVSQERVVEEMTNAQLFLLPGVHERRSGRAETQGLVIQEAQAMELPVIVSDVGGMKYGLLDGVSGFVLKERDLESFADKIEYLIKDESLRARMGKAGRAFVVDNFDTKILGDKLVEIYTGLMRK